MCHPSQSIPQSCCFASLFGQGAPSNQQRFHKGHKAADCSTKMALPQQSYLTSNKGLEVDKLEFTITSSASMSCRKKTKGMIRSIVDAS